VVVVGSEVEHDHVAPVGRQAKPGAAQRRAAHGRCGGARGLSRCDRRYRRRTDHGAPRPRGRWSSRDDERVAGDPEAELLLRRELLPGRRLRDDRLGRRRLRGVGFGVTVVGGTTIATSMSSACRDPSRPGRGRQGRSSRSAC
jgi:hypothetical protein